MTATISTPALASSTDSLLRFGMRLDATLSASMGILIVLAAAPLSRLSGLSVTAEWIIGASFVIVSLSVYTLAALPDVRRTGTALMVGNVMFAALSVVTVTTGWLPLTGFGVVAVLATGLYTLAIGCFQYFGVRRLA